MKTLLRGFLINLAALFATTQAIPGLYYEGGFRTLAIGAIGLMIMNLAVVPLLKIMFLPLNLLTLGFFAWIVNVVALYLLTTALPQFKLIPYTFPGINLGGITIPAYDLNVLMVAVAASLMIGFIAHFLQWLCHTK